MIEAMDESGAGRDHMLRFARCLYLVEEKGLSALPLRGFWKPSPEPSPTWRHCCDFWGR